jgi:hypothetical protein
VRRPRRPRVLDPFDGYLAGLLHNTGWTALLRAIDGFEDMTLNGAQLSHPEVVPLLLQRRDALFGAIVGPWNLSAAVDGLAADVGRNGVDGVESPLGGALRQADRLAALRALAPAGQGPRRPCRRGRRCRRPCATATPACRRD